MDIRRTEKEYTYPNLSKQIGPIVLWKLQRNKANEPENEDIGKNNLSQAKG